MVPATKGLFPQHFEIQTHDDGFLHLIATRAFHGIFIELLIGIHDEFSKVVE